MSSPLAIAAVTAALKDLLNDGFIDHDLSSIGSFSVTAIPPDRISTGQNEPNQLNVFLYQVTPNLGWRNVGLPSRDGAGTRLTNPPLALDLHYLITAYGAQDMNAEILLGYAVHLLHETPVLSRAQLRTALGGVSPVDGSILPSPFGALSAADLADQVELIKLTPVFLSTEDLSKIWTAMQSRYRPTMAYTASVVLIQSDASTASAPPVLRRGPEDRGPAARQDAPPALRKVRPAASDSLPAMRLGDDLLLDGSNLDGGATLRVVFEETRSRLPAQQIDVAAGGSASQQTVHLPSVAELPAAAASWAAGSYAVSLQVQRPGVAAWSTNAIPIALAPRITVSPLQAAPGDIELTVTCVPRLLPAQEAGTRLVFGTRSVAPKAIGTPADPASPTWLSFTVPAVEAGEYLVRLRVDGIDSLPVTLTGSPPQLAFDPAQKVKVQ